MLREKIKPYLVEWPMSDQLDPINFQINRLVSQLDDIALGYEAKWGIGTLECACYKHAPELGKKWDAQVSKINDAIQERDIVSMAGLVEGAARGYAAMENAASRAGLKPNEVVFFEARVGSHLYKVVRTIAETRQAHKPGEPGVRILSCEEMCNFFDKEYQKIYAERENISANVKDDSFNWVTGSELPPEF